MIDGRPTTIISVVRAFNNGGVLGLCGAVVMAAPKEVSNELAKYVSDANSDLVIGPNGGQNTNPPIA